MRLLYRVAAVLTVASVLATAACGSETVITPDPTVARISLRPRSGGFLVGAVVQYSLDVQRPDSTTYSAPTAEVQFRSTNSVVLTIDSLGTATGRTIGYAYVVARYISPAGRAYTDSVLVSIRGL